MGVGGWLWSEDQEVVRTVDSMSDSHKKLKAAVDRLHDELGSMENVDTEVRDVLQGAVEDIDLVLKRQESDQVTSGIAAHHASIIERLSTTAQYYEGRHPTLSGILGSLIDTLSNMGI